MWPYVLKGLNENTHRQARSPCSRAMVKQSYSTSLLDVAGVQKLLSVSEPSLVRLVWLLVVSVAGSPGTADGSRFSSEELRDKSCKVRVPVVDNFK